MHITPRVHHARVFIKDDDTLIGTTFVTQACLFNGHQATS
jgi:hypothetical protein